MALSKRKDNAWYYQPWLIVILLFFVLGPFALPLLFKAPTLNKVEKIVLFLMFLAGFIFFSNVLLNSADKVIERFGDLNQSLSSQ